MAKTDRKKALAQQLVDAEDKKKKKTRELKAKFIKIKLAAVGINFKDPEQRRNQINRSKNTKAFAEGTKAAPLQQNQRRIEQERDNINKGTPIKPTGGDAKMNLGLKKKLAKIRHARIDHEHGHSIIMKGHSKGIYRAASLEHQQGHYAKYWLLNAKDTNGNGWGIAAHSAKTNMHKFIGKPLVITSAKWRGSKVMDRYGDTFDHPYIPTNDLNKIYQHQEQYRVGNIVDIGEKDGDYYAMIEMLPKFANMSLPPFCSPAIFQLDAREAEGQISKWEALHLAALDTDPAYGARIAILRGTCVGSNNECRIQFKSAKKKPNAFSQERQREVHDAERELSFKHSTERVEAKHQAEITKILGAKVKRKLARVEKGNSTFESQSPEDITDIDDIIRNIKPIPGTAGTKTRTKKQRTTGRAFVKNVISGTRASKFVGRPGESKKNIVKRKAGELLSGAVIMKDGEEKDEFNRVLDSKIVCTKSVKAKLSQLKKKLKLASQGEENMTFQKSKKIRIHKRKHPEVRKAKASVEDILRKSGSSVDGSHGQSSFLSTKGDFIGGGGTHERQINTILGTENDLVAANEDNSIAFSAGHGLPRVQNFPINKAGERILSFGIHSKINSTQLKSITDSEIGGRKIGFAVGKPGSPLTTGHGSKDLNKALKEHRLL